MPLIINIKEMIQGLKIDDARTEGKLGGTSGCGEGEKTLKKCWQGPEGTKSPQNSVLSGPGESRNSVGLSASKL